MRALLSHAPGDGFLFLQRGQQPAAGLQGVRGKMVFSAISVAVCVAQVPGVVSVRDLHVWALKPGMPLLATHLNIEGACCSPALHSIYVAC